MKRTMATALGIFVIGIMTLLVPMAHASQGPTAIEDNQGNRIIFTAGSLTAEFEGMVPKVKFYDHTQTMIRVEQQVNFRSLIEFNDSDGDKIFQTNEKLFQVTLDEARWTHTILRLPSGSGVNVTFTLADPASVGLRVDSTVILVVKAYNTTQNITVDGKNVAITTAEIKFDVVVSNWPFRSQSNMLALQVNLHSSTEHLDFDEQGGTVGVDASHDEGVQTTEHQFHETSNVEQETRFSSGPITTSSTVGFFRFVNKATVTPTTGSPYSVNVMASYKSEAENDGGDRETFMKLYLAYPSFQGTLTHDPSIGLGGGLPTLYFIVGGVAVVGLLAVVAIRRRHPQVQKDSKQN